MKKIFLSQIVGIGLCTFIIYSCSKSDISLLSEEQTNIATQTSNLEDGLSVQTNRAPTRKAKQYTITDPETGQIQVFYDCREPGTTCDVGENPPPPPPPNGKSLIKNQGLRQAFINEANGKNTLSILNMFDIKREELINIFPKVYEKEIHDGILSGHLKFKANEAYLAIIENSLKENAVYVYLSEKNTSSNYMPPIDSTKNKVAKINTETGVIECLDPGSNCVTSRVNNFNNPHNNYIQLINNVFQNKNLGEAVLNKTYKLYETHNYLELKPSKDLGESYYILK